MSWSGISVTWRELVGELDLDVLVESCPGLEGFVVLPFLV